MSLRPLCHLLLVLLAVGSTGCFQIDYALTLEEDLSGTASFDMVMNLEGMAEVMATVQRGFSGDSGPPTPEEVEAARLQLEDELASGVLADGTLESQMSANLPPGFDLLHAGQTQEGLRTSFAIGFRFNDVRALDEMHLGPGADATPADTRPFGGLQVVEDGPFLIIRNEALNPIAEAEANSGMIGETDALVEAAFEDLRLAFSIEAPFEIVEHNATRQDGQRLVWVYDYEALSGDALEGIRVRYRR